MQGLRKLFWDWGLYIEERELVLTIKGLWSSPLGPTEIMSLPLAPPLRHWSGQLFAAEEGRGCWSSPKGPDGRQMAGSALGAWPPLCASDNGDSVCRQRLVHKNPRAHSVCSPRCQPDCHGRREYLGRAERQVGRGLCCFASQLLLICYVSARTELDPGTHRDS